MVSKEGLGIRYQHWYEHIGCEVKATRSAAADRQELSISVEWRCWIVFERACGIACWTACSIACWVLLRLLAGLLARLVVALLVGVLADHYWIACWLVLSVLVGVLVGLLVRLFSHRLPHCLMDCVCLTMLARWLIRRSLYAFVLHHFGMVWNGLQKETSKWCRNVFQQAAETTSRGV